MRTFAIGDLQGCLDPLRRLLDDVQFDAASDRLWFVGDLINRGPQSLECLRFVKSLGTSATTVLGNHDLHLLAVIQGLRKPSKKDTLDEILIAGDRDELEHWLRHLPLLHHDTALDYTMVHAGLHTDWDLATASELALAASAELQSDHYPDFLEQVYKSRTVSWSPDLPTSERLCFAVNCFTRMRYLIDGNTLDFSCTDAPPDAPEHLQPWFEASDRQNLDLRIVFGHWSSLGGHCVEGVFPLDTGCVWGNTLTAMELATGGLHSVRCDGAR